ncbi:XRE/MutR family transcriptional regulator [Lactococcus lactis]|uniref:XRE/MutR family transcriptional regulator n=1 Tax=Lactococcus lactis TaxID=1358 RepID=UPI002072F556|nr:XRE/MutR family transcriptional regulator [Lactococcus lactis]MCM6841190.1 XRE/MutR family transcriptional regulator [Lactococcus lactis]MCM6847817.1 XRE/MutR family transcriptional regulator [Lactococcus lactis]MCM6851938.1 XRE/MutR family transcriptional regulator [Lactococcus lactis]MCM6859868.1 XRE/MutR family transcriptional regulator [Lactococcus lactis]
MVKQYYGLKLQELCEAKEITKNEFIKKTGIPKSSLSRFFSGEGYLNLDQIDALLEFLHLELSEYDYYLNNFKHSFYEELFSKIDQAATNNNIEELKDIAWQCEQIGEHLIALCAKARLEKLPENEVVELSSFILGIEIFSFYELLILSDTIEQFSSEMIKAIIQDLSHHHQRLANRTRYRKIICQIACRGAVTCIQEGKEKEAQECLALVKAYCHEKDAYSRLIYRFTKGYYCIFYGQGEERLLGIESMKKVIEIFDWEGSINLAKTYQKLYDKYVKNYNFPQWLSDILGKDSI